MISLFTCETRQAPRPEWPADLLMQRIDSVAISAVVAWMQVDLACRGYGYGYGYGCAGRSSYPIVKMVKRL